MSHKNRINAQQMLFSYISQRGLTKSITRMHSLECIYSPFPALFFSSSSMDNNPCLVDRAWHNVQAQRLPGNRRGCTFGPNYPSQPPPSPSLHLHLNWFLLLKEKRPQPLHPPTHPTSLSLPCCPQGWGCSLAMTVRLAAKPPVLLKLGTSYNERHLRRTGKAGKVRGSLLYSAVPAYVLWWITWQQVWMGS